MNKEVLLYVMSTATQCKIDYKGSTRDSRLAPFPSEFPWLWLVFGQVQDFTHPHALGKLNFLSAILPSSGILLRGLPGLLKNLLLSTDFPFSFPSGTFRQSVLSRVSSDSWKPSRSCFNLTSYLRNPWKPEGKPGHADQSEKGGQARRQAAGVVGSGRRTGTGPQRPGLPLLTQCPLRPLRKGAAQEEPQLRETRSVLSSSWRRTGLEVRNRHRTVCWTETKNVHCQQPFSQEWQKVTNRGRERVPWGHPKALQKWSTPALKARTFFLLLQIGSF